MTEGGRAFAVALQRLRENGLQPKGLGTYDESDVARLETRLGVRLPPSYRAMLLDFGSLRFEGMEFYGLVPGGHDAVGIPNVVFATESDRASGAISPAMVHINQSGYGPFFVLDCSAPDDEGEAPVYEIQISGTAFGQEHVAPSFGAFVLGEVEGLLRSEGLQDGRGSPRWHG
ncbi:SMI1/KNR4 family protein [Aureimonas psammosilenae]|uniref:SMI1/KNR4 family protein n=1 Tax=Aureimonas psammosilenae TaxID=2495496 RepID=UPI001260D1CA|nr:SMI1/KNR4 family protein [Aureimonas psammosilenae]